ncbi:MAG: hypothetical protein IKP00_11635 [Victivallales bacterium]|nr:hypothetical protein [Victivallales bacterium]
MSDNFGNIGDSFPEKDVKCRVRGCKNIVHISAKEVMRDAVNGKARPARMCDECVALFNELSDKEMPCSKPGCTGTWIWNRYQQLEAMRSGRTGDPHGFCDACREEMKSASEKQIPCRLKGCKNTWTLTAREQMELGGKPIPRKLCDECFHLLNTLTDKEVKCRVKGCENTWVWNRFMQLEHIKSGKSLDNPPNHMCDSCFNIFNGLKPIEQPCRIRGCKNTWVYSTYEQLEQIVKAKNEAREKGEDPATVEPPPPPSRMCRECYTFFSEATDIQRPCRNKLCKNTWTYTRSMQLAHKQFGHGQPPSHYCDACAKLLETLQDKEMPCRQTGCDGTWLYIKDEQLRDLTAGREPKPHYCRRCQDFLKNHPSIDVACEKCGRSIEVSNIQQLECELGISTMPKLCADCTRASMDTELGVEDTANVINRPKIYIPKSGEWLDEPLVRNAPDSVTPEKIAEMSEATVRIVCIGDEMTVSCEDASKSWPVQMEAKLRERFSDATVLNVGIPKSTTAMALKRFGRDVAPFKPQVVVFSFAFAEAMGLPVNISQEEREAFLVKLSEDTKALCNAIREIGAKPLCWLPNPIYTAESDEEHLDAEAAAKRSANIDAVVHALVKACAAAEILPPVDARFLFGVNGEQSSRRWMANWFMHNDIGAGNIAGWIKDQINDKGLLEGAEKISV